MTMRGFTLVEILVALAVLATALAAAIRVGGMGGQTAADLRTRQLAGWAAENRAAELRAFRIWPAPGDSSGEVELGGETLRWRQVVTQTPNPLFRRVEIKVSLAREDATPSARLVAYLAKP